MDDKKLKLVPKKLGSEDTFWNCCPRLLQYYPEEPCSFGKPKVKNKKVTEEPKCAWWINSEKHNYCFWSYVKTESDAQGVMKSKTQNEVARLFGWSNTKAHFMVKEAECELIEALKAYDAIDLISE
jgi:hypothetical protein